MVVKELVDAVIDDAVRASSFADGMPRSGLSSGDIAKLGLPEDQRRRAISAWEQLRAVLTVYPELTEITAKAVEITCKTLGRLCSNDNIRTAGLGRGSEGWETLYVQSCKLKYANRVAERLCVFAGSYSNRVNGQNMMC